MRITLHGTKQLRNDDGRVTVVADSLYVQTAGVSIVVSTTEDDDHPGIYIERLCSMAGDAEGDEDNALVFNITDSFVPTPARGTITIPPQPDREPKQDEGEDE